MFRRAVEGLFGTHIKPQERQLVALLALTLFLLLMVYYMLKVVREPLILLEGGVHMRNAARGLQAGLLLFLVPLYGALVNRRPPRKLVTEVFATFLLMLLAFPLLAALGVAVGFAFFVWLGIFSITVIAQVWSLATDIFSEEAGKRVFAIVAAGGTLGGLAGAQAVAVLKQWFGPMQLMLVASVVFATCVVLTRAVQKRSDALMPAQVSVDGETSRAASASAQGGFRLIARDRYLLLLAVSVVLLNLVNTTGDQVMAMIVQKQSLTLASEAARQTFLMGFYANFQSWVGLLTALIQVLTVARLVRFAGLRVALLTLPLFVVGGYGLLAALPALLLTKVLKVVENSAGYSLQNTVQQILFLPTSRDAKFKAKAATDTFFVRFGDLGSWAVVSVALAQAWNITTLALINVGVAAVWTLVSAMLAQRYDERSRRLAQLPPSGRMQASGFPRPLPSP